MIFGIAWEHFSLQTIFYIEKNYYSYFALNLNRSISLNNIYLVMLQIPCKLSLNQLELRLLLLLCYWLSATVQFCLHRELFGYEQCTAKLFISIESFCQVFTSSFTSRGCMNGKPFKFRFYAIKRDLNRAIDCSFNKDFFLCGKTTDTA